MIDPRAAYGLWILVPVAAVMSVFPTRADVFLDQSFGVRLVFHTAMEAFWARWSPVILATWIGGAALFVMLLTISEQRFRRLARQGAAGPAVMGVGWLQLVTPHDYQDRFTDAERAFVLSHERAHILRDDPSANLLIVALQTASWFNPLAHLAAVAARMDQELACDATVVSGAPHCRYAYAATLVKAQLNGALSPFACAWAPWARHPLELRLKMLARRPQPPFGRYLASGAVAVAALAVAAGVWIAEPQCALSPALWPKVAGLRPSASASRPPARFILRIKLDPGDTL